MPALICCDAHNHLHDGRLRPWLGELLRTLPGQGIRHAVVNGTRPGDWPSVVQLCTANPWLTPSCGLHPWYVNDAPARWQESLGTLLQQHPQMHIGEIGLDTWIAGHDPLLQREAFSAQWHLAVQHDRAISVHCVRAFEPLRQALRKLPHNRRGFLLHAYSGPADLVPFLVEKGARFSFSPYFLQPRKARERSVFANHIPEDRLLIETDAPDLAPPPESGPWLLAEKLHDPRSLPMTCAALAALRGLTPAATAALTTRNWLDLFG